MGNRNKTTWLLAARISWWAVMGSGITMLTAFFVAAVVHGFFLKSASFLVSMVFLAGICMITMVVSLLSFHISRSVAQWENNKQE